MVVYIVHEPPSPPADRAARAEALVFIRDTFSWGAALVPPLWLMVRGEWLVLALYAGAVAILSSVLTAFGAKEDWVGLVMLAFNALFGLEAGQLRSWLLARAGWREIATVSGKSREECERRFFDAWLPGEPLISDRRAPVAAEVRSLTGGWLVTQIGELRHLLKSRLGFEL